MKTIGVIDIGSNSIRLVVVKILGHNSYEIIDEVKQSIRLGKDLTPDGKLNPVRMEKALDTLRFYKNLCEAWSTDKLIIVATEAVRKASNQQLFLDRIKNELNLPVKVLSGEQEAFYDYFGAINSLDLTNGLIMDIGGSSTELVLVKNRKMMNWISLPFGAINLSEKLNFLNPPDHAEEVLTTFLEDCFSKISWLVKGLPLIGIGGTFRNIAKIDKKLRDYPLELSHNYCLNRNQFEEIYTLVKNTPVEARKTIKGLSKDRADIFLGAITAIKTLLTICSSTDICISGYGLREGLIFEYIFKKNMNPLKNVLDFSLGNLLTNYDLNKKHAFHVWQLCQSLFVQLEPIHTMEKSLIKVLKTAALLHDCGINISYYDHHLHSFYIILNSRINGLTHRELIMAAYITALHRKEDLIINPVHKVLLSEQDIECVRKLGVILRLAEGLDRRMNSNIKDIKCKLETDVLKLKLLAQGPTDIEVLETKNASSVFTKIFRKELSIDVKKL
ncbi:MAG: Ppx/GppA phosphatase family protein [Desulfitobacteriaceae bacterium]